MHLKKGIGVATAIVREGRLLLGRRISVYGNGLWQTPGGKPDRGESLAAAACRETYEETGLIVSEPREIARQSDDFPEIGYRYVTVFFAVRCERGEPENREPDKCEGWSWHPLDALPKDRFAIDEATIAAIRAFVDGDGVGQALRVLMRAQTFLSLATVDEAAHPNASYVPYGILQGKVAFAVSALAAHARHLAAREAASFVIVGEPAVDAYARVRLTVNGAARKVEGRLETEAVWDALAQRHGATVAILRNLGDFSVYAVEPESARLVLGFASAYEVAPDVLTRALRA